MEAPGRVELPTLSLGNSCSIHLSYGAIVLTTTNHKNLENIGFLGQSNGLGNRCSIHLSYRAVER